MNAHTRPPIRIQVIIGNIRDGRAADAVSRWTLARANALPDVLVETLDLREWLLPHFAETSASLGDPADPSYSTSVVQDWNDTIACADAYVFITPEYNHGIPGVLKNALDSVFASFAFRNKPAMFVAYSAGPTAGARAVEQLALVAIEAELVPLRNSVLIGQVGTAFDRLSEPVNPAADTAMSIALQDLSWWAHLLREARAEGTLQPAYLRARSA
jgi:NAD(P)H-dependent FMN reductase